MICHVGGLYRFPADHCTPNPHVYLNEVSPILSKTFVQTIAGMASAQGFKSAIDVKLGNFDPSLPDIDLLVVSEEATLGYVVLACELKSPIPPQWAKDHLRVLNADSVVKGFDQLDYDVGHS
jgi:hypothetical protein